MNMGGNHYKTAFRFSFFLAQQEKRAFFAGKSGPASALPSFSAAQGSGQ